MYLEEKNEINDYTENNAEELLEHKKEHKTWAYSLNESINFIRNMAEDINYAEKEGELTAVLHYLREYEKKL